MEDIKTEVTIKSWLVMHLIISGILVNVVGAWTIYKQFYLGQSVIMIGSMETYDAGDKEQATFSRNKR